MREHQQGLDRVDPRILKPAEKNPRTHSPRQLAGLQKLIGEYGFTAPVLVDEENEILAGHGRVAAAIAAGLDAVPVQNSLVGYYCRTCGNREHKRFDAAEERAAHARRCADGGPA